MRIRLRAAMSVIAVFFALIAICVSGHTAQAGVASKVIQEALEFTTRKFGKEVAEEGIERLAAKMSALAARHSDDVVAQAFKRVGPRTAKLVTEAGEHGDDVLRLLARHGDAAIPLATRQTSLNLIKKVGAEAGEACVKHGSIAEPIIHQFGEAGAKAMTRVSERSGRKLAMLTEDRLLKPELIDVVIRYGDKACDFIYRNSATLAGTAALMAFVASPAEFLDGTAQLTSAVVKPLAEVPKAVAVETARQIPWRSLGLCVFGAMAALTLGLLVIVDDRRTYLKWAGFSAKVLWQWLMQRMRKT